MTDKIGIVIVNYNDSDACSKLVNSIKSYKCLSKIVVVDNNSSDNSMKVLEKLKSNKVEVIKNTSRHYSSGMNTGAKYLLNKYDDINIIFSNTDIIIDKEEDIIKLSNDIKDDIVVVGPTISEHGSISRGWKMPTVNHEILNNLILVSRHFINKMKYDDKHYDKDISYVDVVSGCFFMVNGKFLKKVDYFDENTFLYYEEQILSVKVKRSNKKIIVDNNVEIIHDHSVSIDKSIKRVNKHSILKTSQRYFCKEYLKANPVQMGLLYVTDKIFKCSLYIRSIFKI